MKLFVLLFAIICIVAEGQRRLQIRQNYYDWLVRAQHGTKEPIVSSRSVKLDRNCFFSPVQCMFDPSTTDNINSFRR
uniref:Uncharacterized protein n=1 Tax=Caenorhabditis japonica TaxID=281687 RepID=A0A8R1HQP8_CAEJA